MKIQFLKAVVAVLCLAVGLSAQVTPGTPATGGSGAWGAITGTLTDQTDLNTAMGLKAPVASPTFTGTVTLPATLSALGTPASLTLTNATGLPESGVSNLTTDLGLKANLAAPTFTGTVVFPNSQIIVTPTIASFANATHDHSNAAGGGNIAISTGISGLATGVATFLGTPSSANLAAALTDELGTGKAIFSAGTLAVASGKTLTASNTLTLVGTDSTTMTFPSTSSTIPATIASGTKALATSAISSAACSSAQTATATGTLTTDIVSASFNGDPTAVTGFVPLTTGMLTILIYPTADTFNAKVCNNTSSSVTPGAITLNWRVTR